MKNRTDQYEGVVARYYDLHSAPEDIAFYLEEAKKAGSRVLDIACGTGRLSIPLAQGGLTVTGIDLSADMLAMARRKVDRLPEQVRQRIELIEGDMRSYRLEKQFDAALVPFRSLMHLGSPEDHRKALTCARDHLVEGGRLVFNVCEPPYGEPLSVSVPGDEFVDPVTFRRVMVSHSHRLHLERQILDDRMAFEELDDSGKVVSKTYAPRTLRWFNRYEMEYLLELCGFRVEALFGDFSRSPWTPGGEQVWVAQRI